MLGVEPDIAGSALASSAVRLWIAAGSAALLVFVCAVAFRWTQTRNSARAGVVAVGAVLGAVLAWAFLAGASDRDLGAERRALELRATELNGQALMPGSPLACLDGFAGESVEAACEKVLFATPSAVAAASSYIAARLTLLADIAVYGQRGGSSLDGVLSPLRRSLETDRFGFVAHVLALRDGCTSGNCKTLALLRDPSRVRANISGQTLDRYVDRYAAAWAQGSDGPVADANSSAQMAAAGQPGAAGGPGQRKVMVDIDFPTAASIPAVSIMNPKPRGPVVPGAAAAAAAAGGADSTVPAAQAAAKQVRKPVKPATAQAAPQAAPPIAPPPVAAASAAPASPAEPVWSPGATLASPQPEASAGAQSRPQ